MAENERSVNDLRQERLYKERGESPKSLLEDVAKDLDNINDLIVIATMPDPDDPEKQILITGHSSDDFFKMIGLLEGCKDIMLNEQDQE